MKLIVGLGNPGEKYQNTRHNLGFIVIDKLVNSIEHIESGWHYDKKFKAEIIQNNHTLNANSYMLLFVKPQTYMNKSGLSIKLLIDYYKIPLEDIIVIHDDIDLPFGKIRVRFGGAAAGHKGVMSIVDSLDTDKFLRIRVGIGRPGKMEDGKWKMENRSVEDYVLSNFAPNERTKLKHVIKEVVHVVSRILEHGIEKYMGKYNK